MSQSLEQPSSLEGGESLGSKIEKLLELHAGRNSTEEQKGIAKEIRDAIYDRDKQSLLKLIEKFRASENDEADGAMAIVEVGRKTECGEIIRLLEEQEDVDWPELEKEI